jgi:hypothetical protein
VELCGRRDAALKKRCQETLGEWMHKDRALFFCASSNAKSAGTCFTDGAVVAVVAVVAIWTFACSWLFRNRAFLVGVVFLADTFEKGIIKEVGQDIHQQ